MSMRSPKRPSPCINWSRQTASGLCQLVKQGTSELGFIKSHAVTFLFFSAFLLTSCISLEPGIGKPASWTSLPGWEADPLLDAWPALMRSCERLQKNSESWKSICNEAHLLGTPDSATVRAFIENRFVPYRMVPDERNKDGLITGYYEPLLHGSLIKSERYRYPLYRKPPDLLTVDLTELFPELANKVVRARIKEKRVIPYYSRAEIDHGQNPLEGHELAWVDSAVDLFFLHIQGSGRIRLDDGRELAVGYADQNGHPYESIGAQLIRMGEMEAKAVNLSTIKEWLAAYPDRAIDLLNSNPSYVFFDVRSENLPGPVGSLNVPLTAERSIAVDKQFIPLGYPVWLDTSLPDEKMPYRRLMLAQDTGGAIKGAVRADIFFGNGARAEALAGAMKQSGNLYILMPSQDKESAVFVANRNGK